jgi:hypothetical protein
VTLTGIASELPSLRARFDQLRARLEERREAAKAEWLERYEEEEEASRPEAPDNDWDVPNPSARPGRGRKKKSNKGKGKSKRKGRRRQGQTAREAGTAGEERSEEREEEEEAQEDGDKTNDESTVSVSPGLAGAEDHGEEKKGDEGQDAEECGICLLILDGGESLRSFSCGHLFHDGCLVAWSSFCAGLERGATCPLCRCPAL